MSYDLRRIISLLAMSMFFVSWLLSTATAQSTAPPSLTGSSLSSTICGIYNVVHTVIFVLGLTLIIAGAAMYAVGNIVPGQAKGGFTGYGVSMIIGGVIGVVIAIAAGPILNLITNSTISCTTP
ncbi:hypothetical protein M1397_03990 [Candidatus Marsarchaeota archaeon]|nr:hypothetical protein [Candidatus Marsarchaeota archaeon]